MAENSFNEDVKAVAAGYLRYSKSLRSDHDRNTIWSPETDPDCAAYDLVDRVIRSGPAERAWEIVLEILRRAPDGDLDTQAAGPLEELVRRRGVALVGQIEREAHLDERFRWALGCIWLTVGDLPPDILDRVVRASGCDQAALGDGAPWIGTTRFRRRATQRSLQLASDPVTAAAAPPHYLTRLQLNSRRYTATGSHGSATMLRLL
jgi:hypothetical protein